MAVDASGNLYIADPTNRAVYKVTPNGALSLVVHLDKGDEGPSGIAVDPTGNLYFADETDGASGVEKMTPQGVESAVAGNGGYGDPRPGPALNSPFEHPVGVALDPWGDLYISDTGSSVVVKVTPGGMLSIAAGTGDQGTPTPGPATNSNLGDPAAVSADTVGNFYIADYTNDVVE